jgi:hypothetical protein
MNLAHQRATPPKIQGIVQGWGDVLTKCGKVGKKDLVAAARNILGGRGLTTRWKIVFPARCPPASHLADRQPRITCPQVTILPKQPSGDSRPKKGDSCQDPAPLCAHWPPSGPIGPFSARGCPYLPPHHVAGLRGSTASPISWLHRTIASPI